MRPCGDSGRPGQIDVALRPCSRYRDHRIGEDFLVVIGGAAVWYVHQLNRVDTIRHTLKTHRSRLLFVKNTRRLRSDRLQSRLRCIGLGGKALNELFIRPM